MDCGHVFSKKYGNAANTFEALERIVGEITDIPLLGSAIYSQWRYFNHWAYSGDIEYSARKRKTKREEFLEIMDEIILWEEWVEYIKPYYPSGKRGRSPKGIEKMLRMYLLQCWFNLSDAAW